MLLRPHHCPLSGGSLKLSFWGCFVSFLEIQKKGHRKSFPLVSLKNLAILRKKELGKSLAVSDPLMNSSRLTKPV